MSTWGKATIAVLIAALAIAGCEGSRLDQFFSQDQEDPSPLAIIPSATQLLSPTRVPDESIPTASPTPFPIPNASPTPSPIPIPTIDTATLPDYSIEQLMVGGPWLLGVGEYDIYLLNADGTDLTGLEIPAVVNTPSDLMYGTSSANGMIAVRSRLPGITNARYALYVYDLPNTAPSTVIPLLGEDLAMSPKYQEHPAVLAITIAGTQPALMWSPDGRYLAFIGAMDGPSADVYALDSETSEVLRLTDGPNQPVLMGWSPDSRWVIHMEATFENQPTGPTYEPISVWAADVEGGPALWVYDAQPIAAQSMPGHTEVIVGWRSDDEFAVVERSFSDEMTRLSSVSLLGRRRETLYSGEIELAAVDPISGAVAFLLGDPCFYWPDACPENGGADELAEAGFYLILPGEADPTRLDFDDWPSASARMKWVSETGRFMSQGTRVLSFTPFGAVDRVFEENYLFWASPDGEWLVFMRGPFSPSLGIYTADGDLVTEIIGFDAADLTWAEDSSGFFLLSWEPYGPGGLYFYELSSGELIELHPDPGFVSRPLRLIYP